MSPAEDNPGDDPDLAVAPGEVTRAGDTGIGLALPGLTPGPVPGALPGQGTPWHPRSDAGCCPVAMTPAVTQDEHSGDPGRPDTSLAAPAARHGWPVTYWSAGIALSGDAVLLASIGFHDTDPQIAALAVTALNLCALLLMCAEVLPAIRRARAAAGNEQGTR